MSIFVGYKVDYSKTYSIELLYNNRKRSQSTTLVSNFKGRRTTTLVLEWLDLETLTISSCLGCGGTGTLLDCWQKYKIVLPLWQCLKTLNIPLQADPGTLLQEKNSI